jgi:hypothetical protein
MPNLWIDETYINRDRGYRFGETGVYETFTDNRGKLFRSLQKEYGRCTSKVYVDGPPTRAVGWVFEKKCRYEDARGNAPDDFYTREVWVTLHTAPPTKTTEYHYADAG